LGAQGGGEEIHSNTKNIVRLKIRASADFTCNQQRKGNVDCWLKNTRTCEVYFLLKIYYH